MASKDREVMGEDLILISRFVPVHISSSATSAHSSQFECNDALGFGPFADPLVHSLPVIACVEQSASKPSSLLRAARDTQRLLAELQAQLLHLRDKILWYTTGNLPKRATHVTHTILRGLRPPYTLLAPAHA